MGKKLCKLVKEDYLDENLKEYVKLIADAKFVCKKCGRVSQKEELLCNPKKMK